MTQAPVRRREHRMRVCDDSRSVLRLRLRVRLRLRLRLRLRRSS
ncbi:hypothetical protein [Streptomyces sp. SAS_272]